VNLYGLQLCNALQQRLRLQQRWRRSWRLRRMFTWSDLHQFRALFIHTYTYIRYLCTSVTRLIVCSLSKRRNKPTYTQEYNRRRKTCEFLQSAVGVDFHYGVACTVERARSNVHLRTDSFFYLSSSLTPFYIQPIHEFFFSVIHGWVSFRFGRPTFIRNDRTCAITILYLPYRSARMIYVHTYGSTRLLYSTPVRIQYVWFSFVSFFSAYEYEVCQCHPLNRSMGYLIINTLSFDKVTCKCEERKKETLDLLNYYAESVFSTMIFIRSTRVLVPTLWCTGNTV
jgi:hypothetical protein